MKKSTHKRLTAWLLTLALVVTLLPGMGMTALAVEDGGEGNGPPAVEVVDPGDGNSGSDETVGTPPSTEPAPPALPESKEEDKTTEGEGGSSRSDYGIGDDTQPRGSMRMPVMPTAAGNYPDASSVSVDGGKQFYDPGSLYYKSGDESKHFTGDANNYIAHYNPTNGTLTLNGYSGGSISVGGTGKPDITVVLIGTNTINGNLENSRGGNITITSNREGTLSITRKASDYEALIGIETGYSGSYSTGNVTIEGDAKVIISVTNNNSTITHAKAYGIFARENITISESASVDSTCATPNNTTGGGNCNGLRAEKNVSIDTNGTIKIDVTKAGKDKNNGFSYGVYPMGTATLTKVGNMEVEWKKDASVSTNSGGAVRRGTSFSDTDHAINVDTTNCYASYRYGTSYYTVTVQDGQLTGPGVKYPMGSGMFLKGDKVSITPNEKKGRGGEVIPFQKWTSDDVTFDKSATTASNSFTVPGKDVTVTAKHSPFDGKPTFTPTGDLNNQGVLTFKTMVKADAAYEGFRLVKEGNENNESSYILINPDTTSTSSPYVYSNETSIYDVNKGNYYVAELLNGTYYLSDKFAVNYVKPRPEISTDWWFDPTDFGSMEVGYTYTTGRNLTITNKGAADTGPLTITVEGANPEAFTVSPSNIKNIAASKSAMSTVSPAKGLAAGIYTATLKISGDNVNTLSLNMKFTVTDPNASASVSGTITSYGSASEAVTVTLLQGTNEVATKTLTGASGSAPYSQSYAFPAVPAGTYTLKVEKKGHAPWTEEITVATIAIAKDVTIYLYGDINGDGFVKANDKAFLARYLAYWPGYETLPVYPAVADLNGDGFIKANDKAILARYLADWPEYETLPKV